MRFDQLRLSLLGVVVAAALALGGCISASCPFLDGGGCQPCTLHSDCDSPLICGDELYCITAPPDGGSSGSDGLSADLRAADAAGDMATRDAAADLATPDGGTDMVVASADGGDVDMAQ